MAKKSSNMYRNPRSRVEEYGRVIKKRGREEYGRVIKKRAQEEPASAASQPSGNRAKHSHRASLPAGSFRIMRRGDEIFGNSFDFLRLG